MKLRKKPEVIDAAFYDGTLVGCPAEDGTVLIGTCPEWFPAVMPETHPENTYATKGEIFSAGDVICIGNDNGCIQVHPGEWIIRDRRGEFRAMEPDVILNDYEVAPDD